MCGRKIMHSLVGANIVRPKIHCGGEWSKQGGRLPPLRWVEVFICGRKMTHRLVGANNVRPKIHCGGERNK